MRRLEIDSESYYKTYITAILIDPDYTTRFKNYNRCFKRLDLEVTKGTGLKEFKDYKIVVFLMCFLLLLPESRYIKGGLSDQSFSAFYDAVDKIFKKGIK